MDELYKDMIRRLKRNFALAFAANILQTAILILIFVLYITQ